MSDPGFGPPTDDNLGWAYAAPAGGGGSPRRGPRVAIGIAVVAGIALLAGGVFAVASSGDDARDSDNITEISSASTTTTTTTTPPVTVTFAPITAAPTTPASTAPPVTAAPTTIDTPPTPAPEQRPAVVDVTDPPATPATTAAPTPTTTTSTTTTTTVVPVTVAPSTEPPWTVQPPTTTSTEPRSSPETLTRDEAAVLLDRWCARAQRSRLAPFVKCARTMRQRRDLILNAVEHGISNGRVEGLNEVGPS